MSGQGKKGGRRFGSQSQRGCSLGDVTLADFANSNVSSGRGRLRKAKTSLAREVKHLTIEDKTWDEKLDEFEGEFDFVKETNEDGEEVFVMKKVSNRRKKTLGESMAGKDSSGNSYPLDVWHLISQYIRPEDTAVFSAVCKDSWRVVNTPTFWLNLYKRYYRNVPNLPSRLQPECIMRRHGLKTCVIRALFYMYPPLAARVDRTPYDLKNRQCISLWQERLNNKWKLSFKLRRKDYQSYQSNGGEKPDLMEILEDIFANADEGCTIFQVVSTERMPVLPTVMGLTLHSINMNLKIMKAHMSVQLVFGSGRICNGKLDPVGTVTLSLKAVVQVRVLDWWHPCYPHSSNIIRSDDA